MPMTTNMMSWIMTTVIRMMSITSTGTDRTIQGKSRMHIHIVICQ